MGEAFAFNRWHIGYYRAMVIIHASSIGGCIDRWNRGER